MNAITAEDSSVVGGLRRLPGAANVSAPRAREAVRALVTVADDGEAMTLAARFAPAARLSSDALVKLWPAAADPDAFAAPLLAPALHHEGVHSLRLRPMTSLTGLRHLTMLSSLPLAQCKEVTDLTEVGALTGLDHLSLESCPGVQDLTPLSALSRLTRLNLSWYRALTDVTPLLSLSRLVRLDI
ncbi:hypothetical protein [Streptomyces sp. NPDC093991]|uniref:hypothetical protein n=1 Tax=unclassified Streptomyces TaxID=2593676 RepID=UPI003415234B